MKRLAQSILRSPEFLTGTLLVLALVIGAISTSRFLSVNFLLGDKFEFIAPVAFLALAMTFVIIAGQIDLSVGSGAVLVLVIIGRLYRDAHVPMALLVLLAPLLGMLLGLFNGALVVGLRLPALVVTLGTLALYRGLAQVTIGEASISGLPAWLTGIQRREIAGFDVTLFVLFCLTALVAGIVLRFSTFGRKVYAIGTNESAARYAGIATGRVKLIVFALSGVAMGVAAVVCAIVNPSISYKYFKGDELTAITAVVLGGTSIFGGRGGILGTVLAVLLLVVVQTVLTINYVGTENRLAILGTLLIGSVVVNDLVGRFRNRK